MNQVHLYSTNEITMAIVASVIFVCCMVAAWVLLSGTLLRERADKQNGVNYYD